MGKTVEQALLEVMEEEELAALRQQQVRVYVSSTRFQQHPEEPFSKKGITLCMYVCLGLFICAVQEHCSVGFWMDHSFYPLTYTSVKICFPGDYDKGF